MESIFLIKANAETIDLVDTVRAEILDTVVVVTDTDNTVPEGVVLIHTYEGKWNGKVVVAADRKAFNRRFWTWLIAVAPDQIAFYPRHADSLRFILGDDTAPFTPDPDTAP